MKSTETFHLSFHLKDKSIFILFFFLSLQHAADHLRKGSTLFISQKDFAFVQTGNFHLRLFKKASARTNPTRNSRRKGQILALFHPAHLPLVIGDPTRIETVQRSLQIKICQQFFPVILHPFQIPVQDPFTFRPGDLCTLFKIKSVLCIFFLQEDLFLIPVLHTEIIACNRLSLPGSWNSSFLR